jgi:hypothetical protein
MLSFQLSVEVSNRGPLMASSTYTARASQMNNCKAAPHRRGACADPPCRSNRPQQTKPTFLAAMPFICRTSSTRCSVEGSRCSIAAVLRTDRREAPDR